MPRGEIERMCYSGVIDWLDYSCGARRCWNRQTGQTQTLLSERTCGFKSHPPYQTSATSRSNAVRRRPILPAA